MHRQRKRSSAKDTKSQIKRHRQRHRRCTRDVHDHRFVRTHRADLVNCVNRPGQLRYPRLFDSPALSGSRHSDTQRFRTANAYRITNKLHQQAPRPPPPDHHRQSYVHLSSVFELSLVLPLHRPPCTACFCFRLPAFHLLLIRGLGVVPTGPRSLGQTVAAACIELLGPHRPISTRIIQLFLFPFLRRLPARRTLPEHLPSHLLILLRLPFVCPPSFCLPQFDL